jgi:phage terminase small subunit
MTPKQEKFCLLYRETGNASEAYRQAYDAAKMKPETVNRNAKALLDNSKIATRLRELGQVDMERHIVTADTIASMLKEDREFAREMETPSAAVTATMGLAKLYGLLTDKTEVTGKDGAAIKIEAVKADAESFKRTIAGIAARIGAPSVT